MPAFEVRETERTITEYIRRAGYTIYIVYHKTASRPFYSAFVGTMDDRTSDVFGPFYSYPGGNPDLYRSVNAFLESIA